MSIRFPITEQEAVTSPGSFRAGGTDLQVLRRRGLSDGDVVDLKDLESLQGIERLAPEGSRSEGDDDGKTSGPGPLLIGSSARAYRRTTKSLYWY